MVVMAVGDQDMVRGRHLFEPAGQRRKIRKTEQSGKNRVYQQKAVFVLDHDAGVLDEGDGQSRMGLDRRPVNLYREQGLFGIKGFETISGKKLPAQKPPQIFMRNRRKGVKKAAPPMMKLLFAPFFQGKIGTG